MKKKPASNFPSIVVELPRITIEKGIPLPCRGSGFRASMRALKVGDSFLVPEGMMRQNIYYAARAAEIEVAIRTTDEGLRVWRLA